MPDGGLVHLGPARNVNSTALPAPSTDAQLENGSRRMRRAGIRMTIAEFSITPIGKGVSVGTYVSRCLDIVDRSGMPYRLNAMGTVVEGSFDDIMTLIARCHKAVAQDCERVSTIVKIDDRKGATGQLETKV